MLKGVDDDDGISEGSLDGLLEDGISHQIGNQDDQHNKEVPPDDETFRVDSLVGDSGVRQGVG